MTVSTHAYTVEVDGQPIPFKNASINFDAARAPLVTATLTAPIDASHLLDPRDARRVTITATATHQGGTQTRQFDLGVRSRDISHRDAEVTVTLASDDALLADYAPLTDDEEPYWIFLWEDMNLRTLVDHILDTAFGAQLAPGPSATLPMSWSTRNVIPNPRLTVSDAHWQAINATGERATGPVDLNPHQDLVWPDGACFRTVAAATSWQAQPLDTDAGYFEVSGGEWWSAAAYVNGSAGVRSRVALIWRDGKGRAIATSFGDWIDVPSSGSTWEPVRVWAQAPDAVRQADLRIQYEGTVGDVGRVTAAVLSQDRMPSRYFDGDQSDNVYDTFDWSGDPYESASVRTAISEDGAPETIIWETGRSALDYVAPILQRAGLRLVCDENRVWTLRGEGWTAPGALTFEHAVNIVDAGDSIDRGDDTWFDAAVTVYRWKSDEREKEAIDAWAITNPPTKVKRIEKNTPYPGKGFSEYAVRRAQQRGQQFAATAVADWTATTEQPVQIAVPGTTYAGRVQTLTFDLTTDEMTITTRDNGGS